MRVTLALLGWTWDWSLEPTATDSETCSLDGGTTGGQYVGFTASHDVPADLPWVERDNGWGDEE